ncbi:MAG: NAD(P)-dependent oxidoreductase [Anaerolineae bacterium]
MQRVAMLGLGIMGSGMADNFLAKGFPLTVYNRTRGKAEPFAAKGARVADTPRQAAEDADIIFAMIGDDEASRELWLGENGALAGAKPGTVLVECSTLTPDWVRELAQQAQAQGCEMLDAPVTGSKAAAANAQLVLFVGGDAATIEKVRPALEAISRKISHLGPIGAGATWKLINNMMTAVHLAALAEGVRLAEKAGLDMEQVRELILNSPSNSPVVNMKLPRLLERRFDNTDFSLRWMHKDIRYALALAEQFRVDVKTVVAAQRAYEQAAEKGLDDMDFSSVIESLS